MDGGCKDCADRFVGCHGKDENGAWRCPIWGEAQEKKAAYLHQTRQTRMDAVVSAQYIRESRSRFAMRK